MLVCLCYSQAHFTLLQTVQSGMGLNIYIFLCLLQFTVVFVLHNYLNGKLPRFKASLDDSKALLS